MTLFDELWADWNKLEQLCMLFIYWHFPSDASTSQLSQPMDVCQTSWSFPRSELILSGNKQPNPFFMNNPIAAKKRKKEGDLFLGRIFYFGWKLKKIKLKGKKMNLFRQSILLICENDYLIKWIFKIEI